MHYRNFKHVEVSDEYRESEGAPKGALFFFDDRGRSWYDVMHELDATGKITVGYFEHNGQVSFHDTKVAGRYGCDGLSMIQVDALPKGYDPKVHYLVFKDSTLRFEPYVKPTPVRTKEDIMADLMKLQAELQAM